MSTIPGKLVEGVLKRVLAPDLTPELIAELAAIGIDITVPLAALYPRTVWYQAVALTAQALFPQQPPEVSFRSLGRHIIESLQSRNLIKGPWLAVAKLAGPGRALKQAMDFADKSPVKLTVTQRSKRDFEIVADETQQPEFLAGLLEGVIALLGGKQPHVSLERIHNGAAVFSAKWG